MDIGYLYGESVYETLRTYHARPFSLVEHLARLGMGLSRLGIHSPSLADMEEKICELASLRAPQESLLRIQVSQGAGFPGASSGDGSPRWTLFAGPLPPFVAAIYERGVRVALSARPRWNPGGYTPAVKFAANPELALAKAEARQAGAFESLLCSPAGELAEGASSNIFLVREKRVITPHLAAGILDGVTRARVLALCSRAGVEAIERRVEPAELFRADEVFLTATTKEVVPVVQVDGCTIGQGTPGAITDRLLGLYQEMAIEATRGAS